MTVLSVALPREVHYGDCTGADYELYCLARALGIRTICHPPDNNAYRTFSDGTEIREPEPYLARNIRIVKESDYLIACPREDHEIARSGTWMTVRWARRAGRTVALIYPDGEVDISRHGY